MSVQAIALLIGAALLAVGLLGGNIKAKDVEVGPVSLPARILSGLVGLIFIGGAFGQLDDAIGAIKARPTPQASSTVAPHPASTPTETAALPSPSPTAIQSPTVVASPTPVPKPNPVQKHVVNAGSEPEWLEDALDGPIVEDRPVERRITLTDYLGQHQVYENLRVLINDVERVSFSIDKGRPRQSFRLNVKAGDRYSLIGMTGLYWTDTTSGTLIQKDHKIRGSGKFSDNAEAVSYIVEVARADEDTLKGGLKAQE